ncbi:LLM class flavin-dependent oxidoreductase [Methylobacterium platani]|uniref:Alkanesulfonate monooxygenase n=2 Tax=Methylobacterium platani TaxID=427683 RepID=A0A179RX99_9HYPH|nr:LLM class flavin-dependent oxidoreductase [Methylobacterium platani]KMO15627.1 alkanesulfonate monooxygenase [Methylobacterium platani JCM 14648]OAS14208.1 alkanesulfonate monooxygenase [Methylobacterium platani]
MAHADDVHFIGFVAAQYGSEIHAPAGPVVDRAYLRAAAQAHEHGGFDRVLIAFHSTAPDSFALAQYVASVTERIGLMIAHRPGFQAPTVAARQLATLDQLTDGRVGVHIITGGNDAELAQDGDALTKDERYARTGEYLDIVKASWTSPAPFDYAGRHYRVAQGYSAVKPVQQPHLPVYFGGSSDAAIAVAGRHADTYALWGETQAQVRETIARVRAAARSHGREDRIRFSLSFRPILAETEEAAWARADAILQRTRALRATRGLGTAAAPQNEGSRRLLAAAAQGERLDRRLYTAIAAETGAQGNSTALVGTPEQVAETLHEYRELGVTTFLIRGFDPLEDAVQYGRALIPAFRRLAGAPARRPAAA